MQKVRLSAFGKIYGDHIVNDGSLPKSITLKHKMFGSPNVIWARFDYVCKGVANIPVYMLVNVSKKSIEDCNVLEENSHNLFEKKRRIKLRKKCY